MQPLTTLRKEFHVSINSLQLSPANTWENVVPNGSGEQVSFSNFWTAVDKSAWTTQAIHQEMRAPDDPESGKVEQVGYQSQQINESIHTTFHVCVCVHVFDG